MNIRNRNLAGVTACCVGAMLMVSVRSMTAAQAQEPRTVARSEATSDPAKPASDPAKPASSDPAKPSTSESATAPSLGYQAVHLPAGRSLVLPTEFDVTRIAITNPTVADATVVQPREILIDGKAPGTISLIVWGGGGRRG